MDFLNNKDLKTIDGNLYFGEWSCVDLAEKFGTPIYVINERLIVQRYNDLLKALKKYYDKVRIHYAVKANTNMAVLSIIKNLGSHLDCVSPGEIYIAKKVGYSPEKILYTGNNYSDEELDFALENQVMLNLDALSQIDRLIKILDKKELKNRRPLLSFRVNPEFGGGHHDHCITAGPNVKFGILEKDIIDAYRKAIKYGFNKFGIHMHIGSGILNVSTFETAAKKFLEIVKKIKQILNINFKFIDFGGGLGIPYHPDEESLDLDKYAKTIIGLFKEYNEKYSLNDPYFCIEPGRFLVAESGIIISRVNTIKQMRDQKYVGINAGFNLLIRPTMYGSYHHVLVANKMDQSKTDIYNIAGQICESGDILAKNRKLPMIEENDTLVILDSGAYGFTMSSNYNSRPRPAEILISGENSVKVRSEQKFEDLIKH
ncbi:MAG: diaminopimelate decarboxylase, partial [Candidatus Lokiarchaeota archaeon]|nr:diaminopimelate decarboxylase [Candidatus Lokiarchaeota archaeon]